MHDARTLTGERIVVLGDDGSAAADIAWLWVNSQAWSGWNLEVLTATEPSLPAARLARTEPVEWSPPWVRQVFTDAQFGSVKYLHDQIDPRILLGDRSDADLLVVGEPDRSHLRALWSGSTTEWLLQHPSVPLAIIRSGATARQVVVCTDGSRHAQRALQAFVQLPWSRGTEVKIVTVDDGRVDIIAALDHARAELDINGASASVEVLHGTPKAAIPTYIDEHRPDLVVLGTRGLTGWKRLRLGSTAAAVAHTIHSSVLLAAAATEQGSTAEAPHQ